MHGHLLFLAFAAFAFGFNITVASVYWEFRRRGVAVAMFFGAQVCGFSAGAALLQLWRAIP